MLLGQRNKFASGNEVGTFKSTSSRECPARAAAPLVLHGCDSTSSHPVNSCGKVALIKNLVPTKFVLVDYVTKN